MTLYIPKKVKQQMRERKRKKKLAVKLEKGEITQDEFEDHVSSRRKRPREVEEEPESNLVVIPKDLDAKATKKFRKEARRKARTRGLDETNLVFVVEGQTKRPRAKMDKPPPLKRSKRQFPCINDMVLQERAQKERQAKDEARQQAEAQVPDQIKEQYVALDCEMVGIGTDGKKSILARASLVDWHGHVLLDTFVKVPGLKVTDFRTHVSGVTPQHLRSKDAMDPKDCRYRVASLLKDKILVGHALKNDLHALLLTHPKERIRDTAKYRPFQRYGGNKWRPRKLRDLVKQHLDLDIQQEGESHDSVDDARATMELFKLQRDSWETELEEKRLNSKRK